VKKKQNKDYYTPLKVIQGYRGQYQLKARILLVTSPDIFSRTVSELSQLIVQILDTEYLSHVPLGSLGTTDDVHLGLIGKHVVDCSQC